ncbi:MAG: hypothetical protein WBF69_10440 [Castellaniella sp.]|uniref:hypothetical protein n=1 Tax=Castellaniella sp. TaxID=1955812 RepID=UPI003C782B15
MAFSQAPLSASDCLVTLGENEAPSGAADYSGAQQPAYADAGDPESVHCLAAPCSLSLGATPWRPVGPIAFRSAQLPVATPPWI